jgi:hypothetical protein
MDGNCSINGQDIGSPFNPVLLIVNGGSINMNGNVNFYGLLYVIGNPNDQVNAGGSVNFYGAVVTEKQFDTNGTFDLIYNEKVLRNLANNVRTLRSVPGSWADYTRE